MWYNKNTYDGHGRLATAKLKKNGATQSNKQYTYDNSGRLTQIYLAHNSLYRNQEYDVRGRLTSSYISTSSNGGASVSYKYEYDNYGNRVRTRYYYSDDLRYRYTWERGRLLSSVSNGNNVTLGLYAYDMGGVRYTKTTSEGTTKYYYDSNTLLGENRPNNKKLRYFYDATGLCGFSYNDGLLTKYYTYVKDVLGNIVMIKDDMGALVARYSYDEWGNCTVMNPDGTVNTNADFLGNINPFRYRGYYYDVESKLYYLMSRYYDPEIGQFISMDSVDYLDPDVIGGVDLYAYCRNNPVMYIDSTGCSVSAVFGVAIGVFLIAATIHDVVQIVTKNVEVNKQNTNDENVQIANSYLIFTPWVQFIYSFYLNHINEDTRDVIQGTTAGVQFEWDLHNFAYLITRGSSFKDVDIGKTLFNDIDNRPFYVEGNINWGYFLSLGVMVLYMGHNLIFWLIDLIIYLNNNE